MAGQPEIVEQLFEAALALKPTEREAFLGQVCGDDPELRRKVEELLIEDKNAGSFLEHPPFDFVVEQSGTRLPPVAGTTDSIVADQLLSLWPPSAGQLKPGQVLIDRFLIVRFIAKGGMGEVYEAEDSFLQCVHVALKTILPHIADDPSLRQRFEREVLLAREVTHPNLCPIYDMFHCEQQSPGFLFLTMKLLRGETLATRLRRTPSISIPEGLAILRQMAAGLSAIHAAGIIHRDIKPNNIVLDGAGPEVRLSITDFGLARAYESEASFSGKGLVAGTPDYMAPELYLGRLPSQASDLFAFGVVLHQVFTGQKPTVTLDSSSVIVSPRLNTSGAPSFCVQLIVGCLDLDPKRRCQAFEHALGSLHIKYPTRELWTRRRFAGAAAATLGAIAGGAWWKRDDLEDLLRPLPSKRFVALLTWPKTSDIHVTPMLTSVLSAIKRELTRFETLDRDLFVISPEDVDMNVAGVTHLKEVCDPLGANLVLAASGLPGATHFQLLLRVLDPSTNQPLREKKVNCALAEITSLPGKSVQAAASLLNLPYLQKEVRAEPGTQSAAAFTAFQLAESLMKQPDFPGLDAAIDNYKQAVELDPRYAVAYAKLAQAYGLLYMIRLSPGALDLGRANCEVALRLAPDLPDAHLALAYIFEYSGNQQGALKEIDKALSLDPSNQHTLVWQAMTYTRLNRWEDAEKTLHRVLKEHPNYFIAYNELGRGLHLQGRYREAIQAFRAGSLAAPRSSVELGNLGWEYLQIGEFAEGTETLKKSLALDPDSEGVASNLSLALRYQGKYAEALPFARRATELNPAFDIAWLELGDCYSFLRNHQSEATNAYLRAAKEAERRLLTDTTDGPGWMLLALYKVKSGSPLDAPSLIARAESLGAYDLDSQLFKIRILDLLGKREEALTTVAACFRKGATDIQLAPFPELQSLRKDPRYKHIVESVSPATTTI
jgi:eukaryotic-like serine/threonine-protein kinase